MTDIVYLVMQYELLGNPVPIRVCSSESLAEEYLDTKFVRSRDNVWQDNEVSYREYYIDKWGVDH